jgi:tRNA modification GTPase
LEAVLDLRHGRCVLFDCAGLLLQTEALLDQLAQQAAMQSLRRADLVLLCVDSSKDAWQEDLAIQGLVVDRPLICVATKSDLIPPMDLSKCLDHLGQAFGQTFLSVSAKTGKNLDVLRNAVQQRLLSGSSRGGLSDASALRLDSGQTYVMLTARLRQAFTEAIDHLDQAVEAMGNDREEIAAMTVRAAYQALSDTEHHVDEKVLDILFSRFCIGK